MAEPGPQLQNVPAPIPPPPPADPAEPQVPQQPAHQVVHLTGLFLSQNFQGSLMRMQKSICSILMTG